MFSSAVPDVLRGDAVLDLVSAEAGTPIAFTQRPRDSSGELSPDSVYHDAESTPPPSPFLPGEVNVERAARASVDFAAPAVFDSFLDVKEPVPPPLPPGRRRLVVASAMLLLIIALVVALALSLSLWPSKSWPPLPPPSPPRPTMRR